MMGDGEGLSSDAIQRISSEYGTTQSSAAIPRQAFPSIPQLEIPQQQQQIRARHFASFAQNFTGRAGGTGTHHNQMPPISPYSQIPMSRPSNHQFGVQHFSPVPTHSRSLSQPSSAFSFDLLPPLSPAPFRDSSASIAETLSVDVSMEDKSASVPSMVPPSPSFNKGNFTSKIGEALPPRKAHRRSISDIPPGFVNENQSSLPLNSLRGPGSVSFERSVSGREYSSLSKAAVLVKREWEKGGDHLSEGIGERKPDGEVMDDFISAYMNLDGIDVLNSSGTDDKNGNENRDDLDSRASGTKTNGCESSDNEAESSVNESGVMLTSTEKKEGMKRSAGGDIAPSSRHYRSISMDSFVSNLKLTDDSPKMPPSPGSKPGQLSPTSSMDGSAFSLEFGSGEFSGAELKKIMANEKLSEIALSDPKRAKRILANRQSAARSKERKMRYISELEHKVQTLQTEATTLSAQLTLLQRDSIGLTNQNNELKFRLQAMEQQAQLRDALNEALTAEVRRLKLATSEMGESSDTSKSMIHQHISINSQMFQMPQSASNALNLHQIQRQQQQQQPKQQNASPDSNR